ncbi:ribonuclease H-like domain-containing protein [Tanacetum coccineum]
MQKKLSPEKETKKSKGLPCFMVSQSVSTEDANEKFFRSLFSAWSHVSLIMRTKPGVDSLSFDDMYNNLRVFESDVKGSNASSSSTQNVAFVSENTNSTNDVSTAYGVSNLCRKLQFDAKEPVGFDKTKVECYNCHKTGHFARECRTKGNQDSKRRDAWNSGNKDGRRSGKQEDSKALVTIDGEGVDWTSHSEEEEDYALMACNSSGSDTEVTSCSKECKESYAKLKKLYDAQREQLGDASIEIQAYTQALKKVEAQLVAHQQSQLWYEEKIRFMKIDLDDKTDVLTYHKKLLAEAEKEKEDLKAKVENGTTLLKILSQTSESETQTSDSDTCESNCSDETHESLPEQAVNEPKVVSQPKVWSDAPIIEEYESDSEDEHVSLPTEEQETPSFANKQVKTPRETIKNQFTHSKNPKVDKKGLGYRFTTKACFVCGSLSHLIKDCDFHEKRIAKQVELNKQKGKGNVQRENKPVWNNMQRVNHKNQFVPTAVLTRTGKIPVSTARARDIILTVRQRPFNNTTTLKTTFTKQKVNTAGVNSVSVIGQNRETVVKTSAGFSTHLASWCWLVQDQTVLGKDYSNLLIADSLLKTIWFINAPCYGNEALASPKANELTIPEQTATGKGISNPLMAGSLPKTTKPT